ncbi:MAG: chromosomal replication initiator protein DnaA [Candidatus Obscuribacterales bacterium]|nr:chromosomal replication initiator protein DnaA [Candidatus Obscuribacterales bacterium]
MSGKVQLSAPEIWELAKKSLAQKLSHPSFKMGVDVAQLQDLTEDEAILGVPNDGTKTFVCSGYIEIIVNAIAEIVGKKVALKVVIDPSLEQDSYNGSIASLSASSSAPALKAAPPADFIVPAQPQFNARVTSSNLSAKYTFDSFVIGSHNRFLHSAALSVAERPGQSYNPLFIYGGVGLGKTHIMQAIGNQLLRSNPQLVVRYLSCETFTNELISYIRDDRMKEFRKRYRQIDVLLIDDIQFIEGKEATQEEFFHTFNALKDNDKQIVLSCDRPPKALARLEDRLKSRFEWGLIADIQTPDLETRLAILSKKAQLEKLAVPADVLEFIASSYTTNIRELEGALLRITAYSRMTGAPINIGMAGQVLEPSGPPKSKKIITLDQILEATASHYRLEVSELRSTNRSQHLALPRHIAMYLAHELLDMSFPRIGEAFSNRKHTSALYAHKRIKEESSKDAALSQDIKQIRHQLSL